MLFIVLCASLGRAGDLLPGDSAVGPAAGEQFSPHLAEGDGSTWLLVWEDTRASLAGTLGHPLPNDGPDLWGVRVDADGIPVDPVPFPIASTPWKEANPRAAWSGGQWLVAFDAVSETEWYYSQGVYAARVDASGALLDPDAIVLDDADDLDEYAYDVAGDGDGWAVLWHDVAGAVWVLDGALVEADGTASEPIRVHDGGPWNGRLAWNVDRYLVVWEALDGADWDVQGRLFDAALQPISSFVRIGSGGASDVLASVAAGDGGFYVAWRDGDSGVSGAPVALDGAVGGSVALEGSEFPLDAHPDVAWSGASWATVWESWSWPAGGSLWTTWAEPDGTALPPERVGADTGIVTTPTVAAADGAVLTAWLGQVGVSQDVWTQRLGDDGAVGPATVATLGAPAQTRPALAAGDDGFLLVAQSETADETRIVAWRIDAAGTAIDAEPIEIAAGSALAPDVAWNGASWLVVWEDDGEILGRRVLPDGTALDVFGIVEGNDPAVAASGDVFLVTSSWSWTPEQRLIVGARVGADGAVLDARKLTIGANHALDPDVVGHATGWTVGWHRRFTHDSAYTEARVAPVSAAGAPGAELLLQAYDATADHTGVRLAHDGSNTLAVWSEDGDLQGRFVTPSMQLLGPSTGMRIATAPNEQFDAAVVWTGTRYRAAWTDWRIHPLIEPGEGDVFATTISPRGRVADLAGVPVSDDPERPEGNAALAALDGRTLAAWTVLHDEAPYAAFRVETAWLP